MFETIMIVVGLALLISGVLLSLRASKRIAAEEAKASYDSNAEDLKVGRWVFRGLAALGGLLFLLFGFFGFFVQAGQGEAKVILNIDGSTSGVVAGPAITTKAPWQSTVDFDLFSQELTYAGSNGNAPSYAGGSVNGQEITTAVGGINGGSTQANMDLTVTYSIDPDSVATIYREYKSQERFTKQIIEKSLLASARQVPSGYNAIEFRGTKRGEAGDKMTDLINEKIAKVAKHGSYGVEVSTTNIQDVRYPDSVEDALRQVEVANQNIQKAEADKRTAEVAAETAVVEAKGKADAAVVKAQGQADANALLNASLTPSVLQQRYIDALGEGTVYVVPDGSTPLIQTR